MPERASLSSDRKQTRPTQEELREARQWVTSNVVIDHTYARVDAIDTNHGNSKTKKGVLEVHAATIFPAKEHDVFGVLAHPMGEEVYRGIKACVKRKILENNGEGDMLLEVHNASEWNVLGLVRGSVVSKMLVETSMKNTFMHFGLVPGTSQLLSDMYGIWRCYSLCGDGVREFLELDDGHPQVGVCGAGDVSTESLRWRLRQGSLVTLYQRFEFASSIPMVMHGAVARAAVGQIRQSFEDLIIAVWRKQRGFSSLPPLMTVIMQEIDLEHEDEGDDGSEGCTEGIREPPPSVDSTSAKSILDEKANAFLRKNAAVNDEVSNRLREELEAYDEDRAVASELIRDRDDDGGPTSHPLLPFPSMSLSRMESLELVTRIGSLRSLQSISSLANLAEIDAHRITSLRSITSLVELEAVAMQQKETDASVPPVKRGFFRRVKSLVDAFMLDEDGIDLFDEDEDALGEGWMVVA